MFKRGGVWWTNFRVKGRRERKSLGTSDRKLAEKIEAKIRLDIAEGRYFEKPVSKQKTFREMAERYYETVSVRKSPRTTERDAGIFKRNLTPFFGDMLLADIRPRVLTEYKEKRLRDGVMPDTVNKELGLMKACFNKAIREWEWAELNPVCRIKMEKAPEGRVRYLTDEEFSRLLDGCEDWLKPLVIIARYTGMRQGNLLSLKWEQVDLFRKLITLPKSKTTRYSIPMCEKVRQVLIEQKKLRHLKSSQVFCGADGVGRYKMQIGRAFKAACRKAGIEDFRWHDLRHDFASQLAQGGVDILNIQKLLNHADLRMTLRYAHLAPKNLAEAVSLFDRGHNLDTVGREKRGTAG